MTCYNVIACRNNKSKPIQHSRVVVLSVNKETHFQQFAVRIDLDVLEQLAKVDGGFTSLTYQFSN